MGGIQKLVDLGVLPKDVLNQPSNASTNPKAERPPTNNPPATLPAESSNQRDDQTISCGCEDVKNIIREMLAPLTMAGLSAPVQAQPAADNL